VDNSTTMNANAATKACPYCGEQILAVAVKCKHCGSSLTDTSSPAVAAVKNQFKLRPTYAVLLAIIVAVFGASWVYNFNRTGTVGQRLLGCRCGLDPTRYPRRVGQAGRHGRGCAAAQGIPEKAHRLRQSARAAPRDGEQIMQCNDGRQRSVYLAV
jgi:hypothetical protein